MWRPWVWAHPRRLELVEVVLDLGRRPIARWPDGDQVLSQEVGTHGYCSPQYGMSFDPGTRVKVRLMTWRAPSPSPYRKVLTYDDVARALSAVGEVGADNRAGINRTLHRISVIRNRAGAVVGLTCRVGRAIRGSAELCRDLLLSGRSVLLLVRPCKLNGLKP